MYKSIIFDIGGVLVDFDPKAYLVDRLCNAEMEEKVYDLTFGSEEWQLLDAGKLSRYDGNQRMLEHARAEGCAFERCRAFWTTGCTFCARVCGCWSWCGG